MDCKQKFHGGTNMSDLAATNCGCGCDNNTPSCGCGNLIWIILLLCCCGGWGHNGCGNSCGFDNSCIWIILLLCCCGGWGGNGGFCCQGIYIRNRTLICSICIRRGLLSITGGRPRPFLFDIFLSLLIENTSKADLGYLPYLLQRYHINNRLKPITIEGRI